MALVKFTNHKGMELTAEQGLALWQAWTGQVTPTVAQEKYLSKVHRIYLNWREAPPDYLLEREDILKRMYKGTPSMKLLQARLNEARGILLQV